ncbi:MAG: histidinol dehydrogenase [Deltaproteobacteria bacterium]|nr:MAG: histidinol dehydrogenase [Deltaproteobacteria bacterium]
MKPVLMWSRDRADATLEKLLQPPGDGLPDKVVAEARAILDRVRSEGDRALVSLTAKLDRTTLTPDTFRVERETIAESAARAPEALRNALRTAARNIRAFHELQIPRTAEGSIPGGTLQFIHSPVRAAALYVPGGRAAYPSSILMNAIPAQVAGVPRIALLTVPGMIENCPAAAVAIELLGLDEVWRIAGAQSIAAAAFGTESFRPVDVIVGPGNAWVAAAKREVYGRVGIDSIAGPSEVLILADDSADPELVALDLLAQAEHDPVARSLLASTHRPLLTRVGERMSRLIEASPRREILEASWKSHGALIEVESRADLVALCNRMAPEHLQVILRDPPEPTQLVAGAMFFGNRTPTALGDYIAGPNHVLPTGGSARFSGPLGVASFLRPSTVVRLDDDAPTELHQQGALIADAEGLDGHAAALRARTER